MRPEKDYEDRFNIAAACILQKIPLVNRNVSGSERASSTSEFSKGFKFNIFNCYVTGSKHIIV